MLNDQQYHQLLKNLNPTRVAKRTQAGHSLSYLEAYDVKAHLIRIFGFGGFNAEVIESTLAFEEQVDGKNGKQWSVGYKVVMQLMIPSLNAVYSEAAVGSASLPSRGDAHDMAVKTAESDALKRAAINLGTQFGLSLYNDGSTKDVVGMTLDRATVAQVKDGEPAQPVTGTTDEHAPAEPMVLPNTEDAGIWYEQISAIMSDTGLDKTQRATALIEIKKQMVAEDVGGWLYNQVTLSAWIDRAMAAVMATK